MAKLDEHPLEATFRDWSHLTVACAQLLISAVVVTDPWTAWCQLTTKPGRMLPDKTPHVGCEQRVIIWG